MGQRPEKKSKGGGDTFRYDVSGGKGRRTVPRLGGPKKGVQKQGRGQGTRSYTKGSSQTRERIGDASGKIIIEKRKKAVT